MTGSFIADIELFRRDDGMYFASLALPGFFGRLATEAFATREALLVHVAATLGELARRESEPKRIRIAASDVP